MDSSQHTSCAERSAIIRSLNDELRKDLHNGRVMLTRAVAELDVMLRFQIISAVRSFDTFTPDNDPWGEHDFGQVEVTGERYFWKIDAYDLNLEFGSPDPSDDAVTCRVITIMTGADL